MDWEEPSDMSSCDSDADLTDAVWNDLSESSGRVASPSLLYAISALAAAAFSDSFRILDSSAAFISSGFLRETSAASRIWHMLSGNSCDTKKSRLSLSICHGVWHGVGTFQKPWPHANLAWSKPPSSTQPNFHSSEARSIGDACNRCITWLRAHCKYHQIFNKKSCSH